MNFGFKIPVPMTKNYHGQINYTGYSFKKNLQNKVTEKKQSFTWVNVTSNLF